MAKSIMYKDDRVKYCFLCGRSGIDDPLELHHIFGGPNRHLSDEDGLTVWLCGNRCHRNGPESAHVNPKTANFLKRQGEVAWICTYKKTRYQFIERYGKDYLGAVADE